MRFFLLGCALLVSVALAGCGKSPHDAIWAKAVGGFEDVGNAAVACESNRSYSTFATTVSASAVKIKEASEELKRLNISQEAKQKVDMAYRSRMKAAEENAKKLQSVATDPALTMSDREMLLASMIDMIEAVLAWEEATAFKSSVELSSARLGLEKMKANHSLLKAAAGVIGGTSPTGAGMGLPPGGPGGAIPGASAGVPGGYGLSPNGPGGATPSAAPATGAPGGFGLPPGGPGGTAPIGATASLPSTGGPGGTSGGVPPGYGLPGSPTTAPGASTSPAPGGAGYGLPGSSTTAPAGAGPAPGGAGYGLPGSSTTAPAGSGPKPGEPGYGLGGGSAPTTVGPIPGSSPMPGGPGYGLPPGGPNPTSPLAPTGAGATLPPTGPGGPAPGGAGYGLPPGGPGASTPGGMPGPGGINSNGLSSVQQKLKSITSPEYETILRDLATTCMDVVTSMQQANNKKGALAAKGQALKASEKIKALAKKLDKLGPISPSEASTFHELYDELKDATTSIVNTSSQQIKAQYPPLTVTINSVAVDLKKGFDVMSKSVESASKRSASGDVGEKVDAKGDDKGSAEEDPFSGN
ncbi:MAG: hypothetical protein U0894_00870 [Pirellulales bacterium]